MKYDVNADFWHQGRLVRAGEKIGLTKNHAKYLGHVLSLPAPVVVAAPVEVKEEPAPEIAAPKSKRGRQPMRVAVVEAAEVAESVTDGDA